MTDLVAINRIGLARNHANLAMISYAEAFRSEAARAFFEAEANRRMQRMLDRLELETLGA